MTGRDLRARSSVMTATEKQQAGSDHLSNVCVVVSLQVQKSADDPFAIFGKTFSALSSWSSAPACQSTIS